MNTHVPALFPARSKPLAACIAALFGLSTPVAMAANTWPVTSCNDDADPHTLRNVIGAASTLSGDIVDLSGLSCAGGKIILYAGNPGIHIAQSSLTISGPGPDYLAIDGSQLDPTTYSAFYHTGSGTLKVQYLTVTKGLVNRQGYALGGCIYSKANVTLVNAAVTACKAAGDGARGGGIWAGGNVTLTSSQVTTNTASAPNNASGGGIWANGNVILDDSTVSGNSASSLGDVFGGGVKSNGYVYMKHSTVSGNSAQATTNPYNTASGAGVSANLHLIAYYSAMTGNQANANRYAHGGGAYTAGYFQCTHCTISNNSATAFKLTGGGAHAAGDVMLQSSTLSGNSLTALSDISASLARGGGAYAKGDMSASSSLITGNSVAARTASAGGAFTSGSVTLQFSTVTKNTVAGQQNGTAAGGVQVIGDFAATNSTVSGNHATGNSAAAGGLLLEGSNNTITASTVSGNTATSLAGGIDVRAGNTFTVTNSTISGNSAGDYFGGVVVKASVANFYNTTIAFNSAHYSPGVALKGPMTITLQSTLMSNNVYSTSASDNDLYKVVGTGTVLLTLSSANNLVRVTSITGLPSNIMLKGSCPLLGPLRDNGGPTMTHALLSASPAIDIGNNALGLSEDQRGVAADTPPYPYPRISGSMADIGAYEVNQGDIVFNTSFESCNPIPI